MKILFLVFISYTLFSSTAQNKKESGVLNFEEVGWTIKFPKDFNQFDSLLSENMKKNAKQENFSSQYKQLFSVRKGNFNCFTSTINPYPATNNTWEKSFEISKQLLISQLEKFGTKIQIMDTATSVDNIDGVKFMKFFTKIYYTEQKLVLNSYWYYRKRGDYDLSITIGYDDEKIGLSYLKILKESKFN
jgi:hypothetical protein